MAVDVSDDEAEMNGVGSLWSLEVGVAAAAVAQTEDVNVLEPRVPPICATVTVQGQSVRMEVDTGAVYSVMDEAEFARRFPGTDLEQSDVKLRGYFGNQWAVVGKATVNAEFGGRQARLPLFAVRGGSRALLGRNWASAFRMPLDSLLDVYRVDGADDVVGKFPELFSEGLGTLQGVKAKIRLPEDARPRFFRRRAIPFALQDLVTQEIQRLVA